MTLANRMRERVTLERFSNEENAWNIIVTGLPAEIVPLGQEQYRVAIRYRPDFRNGMDAEPASRILWGPHTLDVVDVTEAVRAVEVQVLAKGKQIEYSALESGVRRLTSWP